MDQVTDITAALTAMADERQAQNLLRFFKTGPGQYGEGDRFIGLTNPQVRMVVKEAWRTTPLHDAAKLVRSPLHEVRLCGLLIMVEKYLHALKRKDDDTMGAIFEKYISLHRHINNWDLVDLSAIKIVGNHEVRHPELTLMDEWIDPEGHSMWQQRIAMVSTWIITRHEGPEKCLRRARILSRSPHDLLHKAAGWMLREAWKRGYTREVREFLDRNVRGIPAVMLSYACEQMHPDERHEWQRKRKES